MNRKRVLFYMISVAILLSCFVSGMWLGGKHAEAQSSYCIALDLVSKTWGPPTQNNCKTDFVFINYAYTGNTPFYGHGWNAKVFTGLCIGPYR